jgi:phosphohistidine phosphatase
MLTAILFRHAKSDWAKPTSGGPQVDDFERRLATRGLASVPVVTDYLIKQQISPDLVLCSSAVRTRETLDLLMASLSKVVSSPSPTLIYEDSLYLASADMLMTRLRRVQGCKAVMLLGHNPGLHDLALDLAKPSHDAASQALATKFPTAALAVLTFDASSWREVSKGSGTLAHFVTPRHLMKLREGGG